MPERLDHRRRFCARRPRDRSNGRLRRPGPRHRAATRNHRARNREGDEHMAERWKHGPESYPIGPRVAAFSPRGSGPVLAAFFANARREIVLSQEKCARSILSAYFSSGSSRFSGAVMELRVTTRGSACVQRNGPFRSLRRRQAPPRYRPRRSSQARKSQVPDSTLRRKAISNYNSCHVE